MKCKHERGAALITGPHESGGISVTHRVCWYCPAQLPLGPAAADTPEVVIEKRAAELALKRFVHPIDLDGYGQAGFLAAAIAAHDKEQG